jgi:ATP-dependent helicase/DNAse subunit B
MLRPESPEPDPEPLARGGLAHAALRDTLAGLREQTGSARLSPARLALARELLTGALVRHEHDYQLSVRPERVPSARRRLQADLERYLAHAAAQDSPLEPAHLELEFGFDDEDGLPALDLGGGVMLRGRIDRIDLTPAGEAVVYDYKGAHVTPGARWIADGKIQLALYMRAAEQLLGVRVIGGMYQPLGGADLRARGVLDATAGIQLQCVRTDLLDACELDALVQEAIELAREAAAQAVTGAIQARPRTCGYTGGCEYPAICRCGR